MTENKRARAWRDVRVDITASGRVDEQRVANARKEMTDEIRAFKLAEVRKAHHLNQVDVATAMRVTQARVSDIERGLISATEVRTLQSYIEAIGGRLKLVADFGDESITVQD